MKNTTRNFMILMNRQERCKVRFSLIFDSLSCLSQGYILLGFGRSRNISQKGILLLSYLFFMKIRKFLVKAICCQEISVCFCRFD